MNHFTNKRFAEFFEVERELDLKRAMNPLRSPVFEGPLTLQGHLSQELSEVNRDLKLFNDKFEVLAYWLKSRRFVRKTINSSNHSNDKKQKAPISTEESEGIKIIDLVTTTYTEESSSDFKGMPKLFPEPPPSSRHEILSQPPILTLEDQLTMSFPPNSESEKNSEIKQNSEIEQNFEFGQNVICDIGDIDMTSVPLHLFPQPESQRYDPKPNYEILTEPMTELSLCEANIFELHYVDNVEEMELELQEAFDFINTFEICDF